MAGASGQTGPKSIDDLRKLSAGQLRKLICNAGVSDRGCIEKADFVTLAGKVLGLGNSPIAGSAPAQIPTPAVAPLSCQQVSSAVPKEIDLKTRSRSASLRTEWSGSDSGSNSLPRGSVGSCNRSRSRGKRGRARRDFNHNPHSGDEDPSQKKKPSDYGIDTVKITADDSAALTIGTNGKTKEKIARASEAEIEVRERDLLLELRGSAQQRQRAKKYASIVMKQRIGPLFMTDEFDDGDLTVLSVPPDVVGYVQGQGGSVLRSIEEEWGTLMFFIDVDLSRAQRLAIFGSVRGRRGSELKVLSAVETKMPGYFQAIRDEVINRDKYNDLTGTWGTDSMTFRDEGEISYALGKQGSTRRKLERSSGAIVQYVGMVAICSGTRAERSRAREYMKWLFQQLEGPVYVDGWEGRNDCTVVEIPGDCIGYITGNRRATLGAMEEEWGTLMFFMNESDKGRGRGGTETLAIFGPERPRRGSELKVMSGIETKSPGFFTRRIRERTSDKKLFDTDRLIFRDEELSYALGKDGATRKKLELASGAILQYVGHVAFIAGYLAERRRCREFIQWLLQQRRGSVTIPDVSGRDDVVEVHIPTHCKGWVTGNRGSELRRMELASGTYMFMALDAKGEERLLIFGVDPGCKAHAEHLVNNMVQEKLRDDGMRRNRERSDSRCPSRRRRGSPSVHRSPPARRSQVGRRSPPHGMRGWGDYD